MSLASIMAGIPAGLALGVPQSMAAPAAPSAAPDVAPRPHGFAGVIDRILNPTNSLGQFGQALVASGGSLSDAMGYLMQNRAAQAAADGKFNDWRQQYDYELAHPKASTTAPHYWESNDGSLHMIGADGKPVEVYHDPTPKMNFVPDGLGGGQWLAVPTSAPTMPQTGITFTPIGGPTQPASGGFPKVTPNGLDAITIASESGGNPGALSPKGARGMWQVMPSTARDPGFGIQPSNGTPADDARVGAEYRRAMQSRYNGNLPLMWGAYNWGPGNVDKARAQYGENWLSHAPAETQSYVIRNMQKVGR